MPELVGLLTCVHNVDEVIAWARPLRARCAEILVVDRGSGGAAVNRLQEAGIRVLALPADHGEGAALRVGMQLARELGYISALIPGPEQLSEGDVDRLALAQLRAPEAMVLGVGPGQAVAGQEWREAALLAAGRELPPRSDYRPPQASGLVGQVERTFEAFVETCFAHPWGSPRVLPLQAMLRRGLSCSGLDFQMESLFLAVRAGIPTVEIELSREPARRVLGCRRAAAGLLSRLLALRVRKRVQEGFGMGGGYAPPTTSPLSLLLASGLALSGLVLSQGCAHSGAQPTAVADSVSCEENWPRERWPGGGDAAVANAQFEAQRASRADLYTAQQVQMTKGPGSPAGQVQGALLLGGPDRYRVRLVAPLGAALLDFVRDGVNWQLIAPSLGLRLRDRGPLPAEVESRTGDKLPLRLDLLDKVLFGTELSGSVQWRSGRCGELEAYDLDGTIERRLAFTEARPALAVREEFIVAGELMMVSTYGDYREVRPGLSWPYKVELASPGGVSVRMETTAVRSEPLGDSFFVMEPLASSHGGHE
ncbi:MAG: hypothetical protein CMP23_16025 [Rickettsiales bacterium]|nr:hypothetical protein [Rickettsiales bacterium]